MEEFDSTLPPGAWFPPGDPPDDSAGTWTRSGDPLSGESAARNGGVSFSGEIAARNGGSDPFSSESAARNRGSDPLSGESAARNGGSDPFSGVGMPVGRAGYSRQRRGRRLKRKRKRYGGVLCFLAGLLAAGFLVFGGRIWEQSRRVRDMDRFLWNYREQFPTEQDDSPEISIPLCSSGQGVVFPVHGEHGESQTAQEIYRQVNPCVVTVMVDLGNRTAAVGTGVIFTEDGYFVTNYHVVEGGTDCVVLLENGTRFSALYVAGDREHDLAVLKLDGGEDFRAAEFGDSDFLTVGDDVYAIGNPLGVEFRGTLTNGIISAINRNVEVDGRLMTLIQTNAALNSGNSGGPLINEYGQVVGLNVVKMSSTRATVEGLGFAIPSASMDRLVNDLLTYGEVQPEPVLGISVNQTGTELADGLWGIEVYAVTRGSSADEAGIREGDYIVEAGGTAIASSQDLLRVRRKTYAGEELAMVLWRAGDRLEVRLHLREG